MIFLPQLLSKMTPAYIQASVNYIMKAETCQFRVSCYNIAHGYGNKSPPPLNHNSSDYPIHLVN